MINNVVLVGRIVEEPTLRKFDNEVKGVFITLAVNRPFKNFENQVETDFIRVAVWEGMAENVCAYCHKGDLVGIRGRISTRTIDAKLKEDGELVKLNMIDVIGERIAFLSSARKKNNSKDESIKYEDIID